jgi:hypothetical protein
MWEIKDFECQVFNRLSNYTNNVRVGPHYRVERKTQLETNSRRSSATDKVSNCYPLNAFTRAFRNEFVKCLIKTRRYIPQLFRKRRPANEEN